MSEIRLVRGPGRPASIDRDSITDAVLAVGFDRLTVAAVARELGVSHAALYHHVEGRDDLVRLGIDRLIERTPPPQPVSEWRAYLDRVAWHYWWMLRANPGLVERSRALTRPPELAMAHVQRVEAHLREIGFSEELTALAVDTVVDLVSDVAESCRRIDDAGVTEYGVVHAAWRRFGSGDQPADAHSRWFALKLRLVLDGLELARQEERS